MSENENKKELDELEIEGVTGGKKLILPKDDKSKAKKLGRILAQDPDEAAKENKKSVQRPLPFPQDRRGN